MDFWHRISPASLARTNWQPVPAKQTAEWWRSYYSAIAAPVKPKENPMDLDPHTIPSIVLPPTGPLEQQVGGSHYKDLKIQPIEYIHANGIPFAEGSVIKYVTRWREKGGLADLRKARHFLDLLIELESRNGPADRR